MQTHVFHRTLNKPLPTAKKGDGPYIIDQNGKSYIDASGGAAVSCLGHSEEEVRQAIHEQVDQLAYAHTGFFTTEPAEKLATFLTDRAPGNMVSAYFVSGGSEAVETALKMARQYFLEIGQTDREVFISRKQSYHGNTLGALSIGGNEWRRKSFGPLLVNHGKVSNCYPYRDQMNDETDEAYVDRLVHEFEQTLIDIGPHRVIGFVAETVSGATLGAQPSLPGYFKKMQAVCEKYGVLLILDEVMCGMGRTGTLFAYEQEDVQPDIVCMAKGLGAGYQPIGATLVSSKIYQAFEKGSGAFLNGHTYLGHPVACAAAYAVQNVIEKRQLLGKVRQLEDHFKMRLEERFRRHKHVGDIRGRGLFWALEFVADLEAKKPFDPELKFHAHLKKNAMAQGLMVYPNGGTINGRDGDHVLMAPPFISTETLLDEILDRLDHAIEQSFFDIGMT